MLRVNQIKVKIEHSLEDVKHQTAKLLHISERDILELRVVRTSIDARKKPDIVLQYSVDVKLAEEQKVLSKFRGKEAFVSKSDTVEYQFPKPGTEVQKFPTVIVGTGPAGLFCGYYLALHGYRPILLERGKDVEARQRDVEAFWGGGKLQPESNVQFGEGGAGTFSDGKLNTLVKDKYGRNKAVLDTFVHFGADEKITYDYKPHIGTDVLCNVVKHIREEIIRLGGEVRFESKVTKLCVEDMKITGVMINDHEFLPCEQVVLAIGHSARDTFEMLMEMQVPMEAKSFAVGLRVEHPQTMINKSQYGTETPDLLGAAPYKLTAKASNGRGVYSFCMCPGGYVVNASSEEAHTAVNGMSYSGRDGTNANSAIIVSVTPEDFPAQGPLSGIAFQRTLEQRAYALGKGNIPVQRYGDFKAKVLHDPQYNLEEHQQESLFAPQCKGDYTWADVSEILPTACNEAFVEGMEQFHRQIPGFASGEVTLLGVESRTSSPVRILRDEHFMSEIRGLYPCGEGAGYAGGITSAAMDGMRVAEEIAVRFQPQISPESI